MSVFKMSNLSVVIIFIALFTTGAYSARILGVYPVPSISHQVVFRALTLELVKRGHEVVTITTDPAFKNTKPPANLTEIYISNAYEIMMKAIMNPEFAQRIMKRGVIMDTAAAMTSTDDNRMVDMVDNIFNNTEVKQLIQDKSQKFDLVIIEGLFQAPLIFTKIFNAPAILFSSLYGTAANYETVGAISRHPVLHPHMFRNKIGNLGFLEKVQQVYLEYKFWKLEQRSKEEENIFLKSRFGSDAPTIEQLEKNVVLLLVNSHPLFDGNRAVSPATVYLGALHMQPRKELPQDLKTYLDNSKRGVVYVSLGTNVRPSFMTKDLLDAFLDAFEQIPYDILWKFDGDSLDRVPKNVKIQKWFPQHDLLNHPNIKLFVMQGGLQSTDEAIDAEVPLVGIPMLGDQWYNTNKYVELGIGVKLDSYTMVAEDLVKAVNTVANDPSFKENMKKLKHIIRDQPERPIDRAVWWTEHALRHKGSRHLIGGSADISRSEYLMLDVIIPVAVVLIVLILIVITALCKLVSFIIRIFKKEKNTIKQKLY